MRYVGIDPGQNGAAVVVGPDGCTVLDLQTWRKAKTPPSIIVLEGVDLIAVEGQHVADYHAALVLSEWCGRLLASLPIGIPVLRPLATSWRAKVFPGARLRREPAKRLAIAAATPYLAAFGFLRPTHDLAEAWCIARWAAFYAAAHRLETE